MSIIMIYKDHEALKTKYIMLNIEYIFHLNIHKYFNIKKGYFNL